MRLTIVNQFYRPDFAPTAQLAASLAEHRVEKGDIVTIITSRGGYAGTESKIGNASDATVHRIWTPGFSRKNVLAKCLAYVCFYLGAAWKLLCLPRQDVLIPLTTPPFIAWVAVLHKALHWRTRIILWNMDCYPEVLERAGLVRNGRLVSRLLRFCNRLLFHWIDDVVCLDDAMRDLLCPYRSRAATAPQFHVIPNWEDHNRFPEAGSSIRDCETSGPSDRNGDLTVVYTGNMGWGHEFQTILAAAGELQSAGIRFIFSGGGTQKCWIEQRVEMHKLNNVVARDYVPRQQLLESLAQADLALITLREDMLGVMSPSKLHAYLAMSLPILYIGPAGSNVDYAINRFGCGASFLPEETDAIRRFLLNLRQHPEKVDSLARRARSAFETTYNANTNHRLFDEIIAGKYCLPTEFETTRSAA